MEKFETSESAHENLQPTEQTDEAVFVSSNQETTSDLDTATKLQEMREQIVAIMQPNENTQAEVRTQEITPAIEPVTTFLDRHPTLGKFARSMMLVAGLGAAGAAFGADKKSVDVLEGDEVITNVIVGGKQAPSGKTPQGKTIIGATITRDGKIIAGGQSMPFPKGSSVTVIQKADVTTDTIVGVKLK